MAVPHRQPQLAEAIACPQIVAKDQAANNSCQAVQLSAHSQLQLGKPPATNGPVSLNSIEWQIIVCISQRMTLSAIAATLESSLSTVEPIVVSLLDCGLAEVVDESAASAPQPVPSADAPAIKPAKEFVVMPERSRNERIIEQLDQLMRSNLSDITGAALLTSDGMPVASRIGSDLAQGNPERTATIAATVMGVAARVVGELKMGRARETIVRAEGGYLLVMPVNSQLILALMLRTGANLGLARIDAQVACQSINSLMYNGTARNVGKSSQE